LARAFLKNRACPTDSVQEMKCTILSLVTLCGIISVRCLETHDNQPDQSCLSSEDNQKQQSSLLQVQQRPQLAQIQKHVSSVTAHQQSKFTPAHGNGGNLAVSLPGVCLQDAYMPSDLESAFYANAEEWTKDEASLCPHLDAADMWIEENVENKLNSGTSIFSRLCKKGMPPQLLEPLAGVLRDPRVICRPFDEHYFFGIDWLVVADAGVVQPTGKKILFDAGGTRFMDAMQFFTRVYHKRGITLDHIYAWEAVAQGKEAYWSDTPPEVRAMWEPRLTFYDGIPIVADPTSQENPVKRILDACRPEDFCTFKLDIDTPSVEFPIIEQMLASPAVASVLDEFFFEHHVHGVMENWGWDKDVNGTFADSYRIFTQLRQMGIRAHSWI